MTSTVAPKPKSPVWARFLLVFVIVLAVLAAMVGAYFVGSMLNAGESRDVQVVRSVQTEEQVILLTVGITDIKEEQDNQDFFGLFDIPLSDRTVFFRYEFDAKFGIDGRNVVITPTGDKTYAITIPPFEVLGNDDPKFSVATEANGLLSWATPEIDELAIAEEVLAKESIAEQLDNFRPLLEDQAVNFYSRIVESIDPEVTLTFEFSE